MRRLPCWRTFFMFSDGGKQLFPIILHVNRTFFGIFAAKMIKLSKLIARTLSLRLSLMVLVALATLLTASLFIMFSYSRKAIKEEALKDGGQTLESTIQNIDNILLDVEQSAGNIYWKIVYRTNEPEKMNKYIHKLAEVDPYISDAQFIWETDSNAVDMALPTWIDPKKGQKTLSFCLPLFNGDQRKGVLKVDVPLALLSKIITETKPSPNSYCSILGKDGSYIIHPDTSLLSHQLTKSLSEKSDPSIKETIKAMVTGETGYKSIKIANDDYIVFYKPFERAAVPGRYIESLGWSAGIIYPEDDIFSEYNYLLYTVLIIAAVGLLLLLLLCQTFIHRQFLPLRQLSKSAQRITAGDYDAPIPEFRQEDEIGRLQRHFTEIRQSLVTHMGEMNRLSKTLKERGEVLQAAYEQSKVADEMKTNFLYNMSNQMTTPVAKINQSVKTICDQYDELTEEETIKQTNEIQQQGDKITSLLNQLIADSEKKT